MTFLLLPLTLLVALAPRPAGAQTPNKPPANSAQPATPEQVRDFVVRFEQGVRKGCLQSPPRDIPAPERYCSCYARKIVSLYQPGELAMINRFAAANAENVDLIALMTAPLTRACREDLGAKVPAGTR